MQKITNNPFRVIGIVANSSAKEIQSRKGKIQAYSRVGKEISSDYDFNFLEPISRREEDLTKAFSEIEQHKNIIEHSLFWFTNLNPIDETAIQHLISGNKEKAIEIWEKIIDGKEISSRNYSAFNNIGTLYFLEESVEKLKKGIECKIRLIESDHFQDFIHSVADEMYKIDSEKQAQFLIDELLKQINGKYSTSKIIALFDGNPSMKNYLSGKFTEEPLQNIEGKIEQSKKKRENNKINAYRIGSDLFENTKNNLIQLKSILGLNDLKYKNISDKVAKELLQCSIDYFNECVEEEKGTDYLHEAMLLAKMAKNVAVNKLTQDRIKDNIATLEGMKDRELDQALQVLRSVKEAYETNKRKITAEVHSMPLGYNQTVNWTKVDQMIEDSLNWDKVVELLQEVIPLKNVEKIKLSTKQSGVTEFKSLVEFILDKLNGSRLNQVKYLCYWKKIFLTKPTPITPVKINFPASPPQSSTNDGCAPWAYWVVGIILIIILMNTCN